MADTEFDARALQRILDTLVPPTKICIENVNGEKFDLAAAIPARRQIALLRIIEEMRSIAVNDSQAVALTKILSGGFDAAAIAQLVVTMAENEKFLSLVGKAFSTAHPSAVPDGQDPLDLFAAEEMVAGLIPLFLRIVKRAGGLISVMAAATPTLTADN